MRIEPTTGLLDAAEYRPSPNCDDRPTGQPVDLIVIHGISLPPGQFGGPWIDALFANTLDPAAHPYFLGIAGLRVSAHLLIRRNGEITQYVPFHRRAYMYRFTAGPGTPGSRFMPAGRVATISASASSWKAPIIFPTTTANIRGWQQQSSPCGPPIPPSRPTGWPGIPRSRRAARPIPVPRSIGRTCTSC